MHVRYTPKANSQASSYACLRPNAKKRAAANSPFSVAIQFWLRFRVIRLFFCGWSSLRQMMFTYLWGMESEIERQNRESSNGCRHGQMSRDGTRYPYRHRY